MNGLELAKHFYFDCVRPIIVAQVPELQNAHAAGLIGYGSDVLANDDSWSRDHEWGPRLLFFLDKANDEATHARLSQTLQDALEIHLPPTFMGFSTRFKQDAWGSLVMVNSMEGKPHIHVTTAQKLLEVTSGYRSVPTTDKEWLLVPEQRLLEFTSGAIFYDALGQVTALREQLAYFPAHIWKYRLAYSLESLGWELGLISLCAKRGDTLSMHLNVAVTVKRVMQIAFYINRQYCPSYAKWLHRQFAKLPLVVGEIETLLKEVFIANDETIIMANINQVIDLLYAQLRTLEGLQHLPARLPRVESRESITIDSQAIAKLILQSIPGPLAQLSIHGAPYGAADQWITHEDMLLSPALMKAFANVYDVTPDAR